MSDRDPLDRLFGDAGGTEPTELTERTLGYDDFTGGNATRLLTELPLETVKIIHRYTFDGPTDVIGHIGTLAGLIEGLHERDPERTSAGAVDLVREEIAGSRGFFAAVMEHDELPFIGRMRDPRDLSDDTVRVGWGVVQTETDQEDVLKHYAMLGIMEAFLADPATKPDFDKAMLVFMNDVIFRPGVVVQRG